MTEPSLLAAAVDELYSSPLAEFTARRKALAAAAKKAGDRVAATAIGSLRKPTLSADTVNRLVRSAPDEVAELLQLGTELRSAEAALDAGGLRRLGDVRRHLVTDLADLAFDLTGQRSPSPAVRDEVTATLNAALADEEVAHRLSSGSLVTQARWDGFGSTQLPELAASMPDLPLLQLPPEPRPDPGAARRSKPAEGDEASPDAASVAQPGRRGTVQPPAAKLATTVAAPRATAAQQADRRPAAGKEAGKATGKATERATERATAKPTAADRAAAERAAAQRAAEQQAAADRAARQAAADRAAEEAAEAATRAADAQELVSTIDRRISELNLQLAHQRRLLADAQRALRAAENERRAMAQAATRAGAATR